MKRLIIFLLVLGLCFPGYADWDSSKPSGTTILSTDVTNIQNNFKAIDGTSGTAPSTVAVGTTVQFEGATADAFETSLTVTDPTADRTITLPNLTGTAVLSTGVGADIDIGAYELRAQTLEADVATGTAPLMITSTTKVANLNVEQVDGTDFATHEGVIDAWVSFDGTGTLSVNDSYNVTSVTDNGTGDYTIAWDTDFANDDYVVSCMAQSGVICGAPASYVNTGSIRITATNHNGASADSDSIMVMAVGDQ